MKIEFDSRKNQRNILERGLPFTLVEDFDWSDAVIWEDSRKPYPEQRYIAVGYIQSRLCVLCFTLRPDVLHVISLRKANKREGNKYGKAIYKA